MTQGEQSIREILNEYDTALGMQRTCYTHHTLRVYRYCLYFAGPHVSEEDRFRYAVAAAFHDLGIWTGDTMDYLLPSEELAADWLVRKGKQADTEMVRRMIRFHHKWTEYTGEFAATVEVFRRADWADVSFGWMAFGMKRDFYRKSVNDLPTRGFHRFLARKVAKWILRYPLRPLPMFRR